MLLTRFSRYLKPVESKTEKTAVNERLQAQIDAQENRSFEHGFLHIPKTGGSGADDMLVALSKQGITCPVKFSHAWRFRDIVTCYPDISVSFILRDPIERIASGFLSRMRMGRPRNNSAWSEGEAAAFAFFRQPEEFLLALIGDDEREKSAALFAQRAIQHVRFNYKYYFKSVENLKKHSGNIGIVGSIDQVESFLVRFADQARLKRDDVLGNYKKAHVGNSPSLSQLGDTQMEALRSVFSREYELYHYLKSLVDE